MKTIDRIRPSERESYFKNSFISPDIGINEEVKLDPGESAEVPIRVTDELKQHDQLLESQSHRETVLGFTNVRSHIMQSGISVDLKGEISNPNSTLSIVNYSPNKAIFREGTKLGYQCDFKAQPLHGAALYSLIDNQDIFPGNSHWEYLHESAVSNTPVGFEFFVSPKQFALKKLDSPVVFNGISDSTHNREFVDQNLELLAFQTNQNHFWVGELSPTLYLSDKVHLVIAGIQTIGDKFSGLKSEHISAHAPSLFLRGGNTGTSWYEGNKIRIEIFGPSEGNSKIASVQMLVFPR